MKKTISPFELTLIALLAGTLAGQAAPVTWTGLISANWSDAGNWNPGLPGTGDTLIFGTGGAVSGQTAPNNDLTGQLLGGIQFKPSGASYILGGNSVTLDTAQVVNSNSLLQTLAFPVVLTNAVTFNTVSNLDTTVGDIEVDGAISGDASGALIKNGGGTLTLANKSYGGGTTVNGGLLVVSNDNGGYTMSGGNLKLNYGSYWSGPTITFTANAEVGTDAGRLDFAGAMGAPGYTWTKIGSGTMNCVHWSSDPTAVVKASTIVVAEGTLGTVVNGGTIAQWGNTAVPIVVSNGAALSLNDGCLAPNYSITLAGGAGLGQGALLSGRVNAGIAVTNTFTGTITLQGDTTIGTFGGILVLSGNISGTGPLTRIGIQNANSQNILVLGGTNTYTGDTTISTGLVVLASSAALPSGASAGNVYLANNAQLDLNGNNASVNGLTDDAQNLGYIDNSAATAVTLTFGGNNQSVSLVRPVENTGGGALSVVKVGSGTATLLGANTYSGSDVISGGKLEINIPTGTTTANGPLVVADGAEFSAHFRLAGSSLKTTGATLGTSGATILDFDIGAFGNPSSPIVNATNGTGILNANGTITVNIAGDSTVMSVGQFPLIKYTTRSGNGNFVLGSLPVNVTAQIVTNAAAKSIDLKVISAPVTTWVGNVNNLWDINTTANWSILGVGGKKYLDGVGVFFGDSALTNQVNIATAVSPSSTLVNSTNNYEFDGLGYLASGDLTKSGSGKLTLTTLNYYNNTTIAGGTLQVDTNGTTATLGSGNVDVEGTLIFARADAITVGNTITGAGTVVNNGSNSVTLSAANTYSGGTLINQGEVILGTTTSLGAPAAGVPLATVASGATLDINGKLLATTNVTRISGVGYTNSGAIINSGAGTCVGCGDIGINNVSLTADATVLVNSDWVVGASGLGISGNGFNLTKLGYGAIYLRASAPTAFGKFTVGGGTALIESANPFGTGTTLVLSNNAATDSWGNNAGGPVNYTIANNIIVTNGGGRITTTRGHWWSTPDYDTYTGAITLNDNLTVQNSSANGSLQGKLTLSGPISGTGSITKMGTYPVTLSGVNTYSGSTTVANGTLVLSPVSQGGGAYTNLDGATLAVPAQSGYATVPMSGLALGSASGSTMDLSGVVSLSSSVAPITATNLVLTGVNSLLLSGASYANAGQYPLIKYTTLTGDLSNLALGMAGVRGVPGYLSNNVTRGSIDLVVVPGSNAVKWVGNLSTNWDIASTLNWLYQSAATDYEQSGTLGDAVTFDDSTTKTNILITTTVSPTVVLVNTTNAYKFFGTNLMGSTALAKSGTGSLTLGNLNNNLTGGGAVNGGSLVLGTGGTFAGTFGVANGATLDLGSNTISTLAINALGAGVGGNGAIQANYAGNAVAQGVSVLNMNSNLTVGGNNRWDIRNGANQLNVTTSSNVLTKVGAGQFSLVGTAVSTNLGDVIIVGGKLSVQTGATLGNTNNTVYVGASGGLDFYAMTTPFTKNIVFTNGAQISTSGGSGANNILLSTLNFPSGATLNLNYGGGILNIASPVNIPSGCTINNNGNYYQTIVYSNVISGSGAFNMQYQSYIKLAASNTFSGNITVPQCNSGYGTVLYLIGNGSLTKVPNINIQGIATGQASPGHIDVTGRVDGTLALSPNQTLRGDQGATVAGTVVAPTGSTIFPGGDGNTNCCYMAITNLTMAGGVLSFDVLATTNDQIWVNGALNLTAGGIIRVVYTSLPVGRYHLMTFGTETGTAAANLKLALNGPRYTAHLDDTTTPHTLDLVVDSVTIPAPQTLTWAGDGVNNYWDPATSADWLTNGTSPGTVFYYGDSVSFTDPGTNPVVNLVSTLTPASVAVNSTANYTFTGSGTITGSASLTKTGLGSLVVSNANSYTNGTFISGGTLILGNSGALWNNSNSVVTVTGGGTLDLAGLNPNATVINVSGAGVAGNGALIANYAGNGVANGPAVINLMGNTVIGGTNRWDLRNGLNQLNATTPGTVLTKVGSGYTALVATTVSTNLGDIYILGGILSFQTSTTGEGNTNNTIYVGNGGSLGMYQLATPITKPVICSNGAAIFADGGNAANQNVIAGPVTLDSGNVNLNFNFYNAGTFSNVISGAGGLTLGTQSIITMAASNTYAGNTTIPRCGAASGGFGTRLFLVGNGSIDHSARITLQGVQSGQPYAAFLDVLGRPDQTLTLGTNQILQGDNGSFIRGSVVATAGSGIAPGGINNSNYQYMSISNSLTFQAGSTNYMDIYKATGLRTNDLIVVSNLVTYGGTLQIRPNGPVAIVAGDTFKLFSAGSSSGNFATISDDSGATWSFTPSTGIATVLTAPPTVNTNPATANFKFTSTGNALNFTWAPDHLGWQLYTNAVGLNATSSWFPLAGSASATNMTVGINPTNAKVFFQLRYP